MNTPLEKTPRSPGLILVTGATGKVGRHLVQQLVAAGHRVRALSRSPARANLPPEVEVLQGDLADVGSLARAFEGVSAVHLITLGGDNGESLTNGDDLIQLAEKSGVRTATVLGGWDETSVESALQKSAIGWTRLEPVEFMSNALEWAPGIKETGAVRQLAAWPSAVVHEADIAAVALVALTQEGHAGKRYHLSGPQALTPAERIALIAKAVGRSISFEALNEEQERERLRANGYPEDYVEFGIQLATNPPAQAAALVPTVEQVTGRPGRTFAAWAMENAQAFRA
ncbi:Oxidoreductase [Myxococcus hansupus]|uniref:Oxidoreductase n=1 Tax=Pseudomyxococcus hansupus TaxID=1297742 RepID=A0A0H4WXG3_9BACT|nr:NAD(P)H-binding protein [Myxococcus hansupus]AKQ66020.1 Oxidoreductase [Myxococcus hansupus]